MGRSAYLSSFNTAVVEVVLVLVAAAGAGLRVLVAGIGFSEEGLTASIAPFETFEGDLRGLLFGERGARGADIFLRDDAMLCGKVGSAALV